MAPAPIRPFHLLFSSLALSSLSLSLLISPSSAQFPIPKEYVGFVWGPQPKESVAVLEAFLDLTCPSCRQGWPALRQAVEKYSPHLRLVLHPFVLPFHHNSHFAARSLHAVAGINASLAFPWLEQVFKHQDEFSTEATWHTAPEAVVAHFGEVAEAELGIPKERFLDAFGSPANDVATRITFKYGCLRAITQTPSYFLNGVPVRDADDSWTLADWERLLNPIIGQPGIQKLTGFTYPRRV